MVCVLRKLAVLVVALLLAPVVAGCLASTSPGTPADAADPAARTAPGAPTDPGAAPDEAGPTLQGSDASQSPPDVSGRRAVRDLENFTRAAPLRHSDLPTHDAAVRWLNDSLAATGLDSFVHTAKVDLPLFPVFPLPPRLCPARNHVPDRERVRNVIAVQRGTTFPDQAIVVAAHYDGKVGSVGHAYDPGSATVMLPELARAVAKQPPAHTIIFAAWDGHECDFLVGSTAWYEDPQPDDVTVKAVVTLDMVGINWPADAPTIQPLKAWIGNDDNGTVRASFRNATFEDLDYPEGPISYRGTCDGCNSHRVFALDEIPYAFFSTFPFRTQSLQEGVESLVHYPFWHRLDTVEQMIAWAGGRGDLEAGFDTVLEVNHHGLIELDAALADGT